MECVARHHQHGLCENFFVQASRRMVPEMEGEGRQLLCVTFDLMSRTFANNDMTLVCICRH